MTISRHKISSCQSYSLRKPVASPPRIYIVLLVFQLWPPTTVCSIWWWWYSSQFGWVKQLLTRVLWMYSAACYLSLLLSLRHCSLQGANWVVRFRLCRCIYRLFLSPSPPSLPPPPTAGPARLQPCSGRQKAATSRGMGGGGVMQLAGNRLGGGGGGDGRLPVCK